MNKLTALTRLRGWRVRSQQPTGSDFEDIMATRIKQKFVQVERDPRVLLDQLPRGWESSMATFRTPRILPANPF